MPIDGHQPSHLSLGVSAMAVESTFGKPEQILMVGMLCVVALLSGLALSHQTEGELPVVNARAFNLVGNNGDTLLTISADDAGGGMIAFHRGDQDVELVIQPDGITIRNSATTGATLISDGRVTLLDGNGHATTLDDALHMRSKFARASMQVLNESASVRLSSMSNDNEINGRSAIMLVDQNTSTLKLSGEGGPTIVAGSDGEGGGIAITRGEATSRIATGRSALPGPGIYRV